MSRLRAFCLALALVGCGERAAPEAEPTAVSPEPEATQVEAAPEPEAPPVDPPPALDDQDLDAMDEPALEAACFAGSMAACDRLGH